MKTRLYILFIGALCALSVWAEEPTPLPPTINAARGETYGPALSADQQTLYFTGLNRPDNLGLEDIFVSTRNSQGEWSQARLVNGLNTAYTNEAPMSVYGRTMLLFREGRIMVSEKGTHGWKEPQPIGRALTIGGWQADAMLTRDGQAMLFAAYERGDNGGRPSINIYVAHRDSTGRWQKPISLGPTINTEAIERSPYLHPDGRTLYFCSDREGTLGGLDVWRTTRLKEDSWTEWSEPENLGPEINTAEQECWYKISNDGQFALFAVKGEKTHKLYQIALPQDKRPGPIASISGRLLDEDGHPLDGMIYWEDLQTGQRIGQIAADPEDGRFYVTLPLGKHYGYYAESKYCFPQSDNLDLTQQDSSMHIEHDITLLLDKSLHGCDKWLRLNNVFFDVDKSRILPTSEPELRRIAEAIQRYGISVIVEGHTDNTGSDEHNKALSLARAESVRLALIRLGCRPERLSAEGFGSSRPVADNSTPEGRQQNRRVELHLKKPQ